MYKKQLYIYIYIYTYIYIYIYIYSTILNFQTWLAAGFHNDDFKPRKLTAASYDSVTATVT